MSKRQIRKRAVSTSSDSDNNDEPRRQQGGGKKAVAPTDRKKGAVKLAGLSFGGDEEEEGSGDEFVVKKSKASRGVKKKMRQAPNAASVVENSAISVGANPNTSSTGVAGADTGGEYSAESLAALRSSQHFSSIPIPDPDPEPVDMELAGDAAVLAESQLGIECDGEGNIGVDIVERPTRHGRPVDALKQQRDPEAKKNKVHFASAIPKEDDKEFQDLAQDQEGVQWEEELLRRAGGRVGAGANNLGAGVTQRQPIQTPINDAWSKFEELSFKDCMKSLMGGITKLEDNCENNRNKLINVNNSYSESEKEKNDLKSKVAGMGGVQDWLEDFRLYCSDVVGMMREKAETIDELKSAILTILSDEFIANNRCRVEHQEQRVAIIREAGHMLTLGGYLPQSSCLLTDTGVNTATAGDINADGSDGKQEYQFDMSLLAKGLAEGAEARASRHHVLSVQYFQRRFSVDVSTASINPTDRDTDITSVISSRIRVESGEKLARLYGAAELLMSDVREDIASVSTILSMFATLRSGHAAQYRSAFVSMSLPPIIGELVKLDMIAAPLPFSLVSLEQRGWHDALYAYSTEVVEGADLATGGGPASEGDDSVLLPKVVAGAVFPWVISLVENVFDPLSSAQGASFADIIAQLLEYDLPSDKSNLLLQKVFVKFNTQLKAFCLPTLRTSADIRSHCFLISQLWKINSCLDNLSLFKSLLSPSALSKMLWKSLTSEWCEVIVAVLGFAATHYKDVEAESVCLLGTYMCVRLIVGVIRNLQYTENILEVLYSQRSIGETDDPVVSATYFIQIRELINSLGAGYKSLGIPGDAVVSVTQAALVMHARLGTFIEAEATPELRGRDMKSDINLFSAVLRKVGSSSK